MKPATGLLVFALGCGAVGCLPQTTYYWGNYENDLYAYYKSPQSPEDHEEYVGKLSILITKGERKGKNVPPGIYAEYGYALYKQEHYKEAIVFFEKERAQWPEAVILMDRVIKNVRTIMKEDGDSAQESEEDHSGQEEP